MPASSLIFVVIVAIWAVSLLQYGVRRRQRAAAARSVDGFSEAMRVLEKKTVLPSSAEPVSRPHSYVLSMGRPSRPSVEVKRAAPAGRPAPSAPAPLASPTSPLIARRASKRMAPDPNVIGEVDPVNHSVFDRPDRPDQFDRPEAGREPFLTPLRQRQLRALLLVASLLWVPVSLILAITGTLMWISVPLALATLVAVVYWLRVEAEADRARQRGVSDAAPAARRRLRRPQLQRPLSSEDTQVIRDLRHDPHGRPLPQPSERPAAASAAFDIDAFDAQAASVAATVDPTPVVQEQVAEAAEAAQVTQEPAPGTWSPVPVPRPTYAMKAKAEPAYTSAGIPADVFDTPEFADEADELDDRALFARRAVSQ